MSNFILPRAKVIAGKESYMTGCPVNIADFRCRIVKPRTAHFSLREAGRSTGLRVVGASAHHNGSVLDAGSPESALVDIGVARESQRLRHRTLPRPISIQRRAKVIRIGEARSRAFAFPAPRAWHFSPDDPCDLPPAA
jgi:hypothetical protein